MQNLLIPSSGGKTLTATNKTFQFRVDALPWQRVCLPSVQSSIWKRPYITHDNKIIQHDLQLQTLGARYQQQLLSHP
jgi:hypothetical protein